MSVKKYTLDEEHGRMPKRNGYMGPSWMKMPLHVPYLIDENWKSKKELALFMIHLPFSSSVSWIFASKSTATCSVDVIVVVVAVGLLKGLPLSVPFVSSAFEAEASVRKSAESSSSSLPVSFKNSQLKSSKKTACYVELKFNRFLPFFNRTMSWKSRRWILTMSWTRQDIEINNCIDWTLQKLFS